VSADELNNLDDSDRLRDQDEALGSDMVNNLNEILNEPPVAEFAREEIDERVGFNRVREFMAELFK